MKLRIVLSVAILSSIAIGFVITAEEPAKSFKKDLPGPQISGEVKLPNGWSLKPAGKQIPLGDFPVNMVVHPSGKYL